MKHFGIALATVIMTVGLAALARAVPPGLALEFDGKGEGKVIFSGTRHSGAGMHCSNCHMDVFYVSRSAQITRADHRRPQFCFTCHNGEKAFAARQNCNRCHVEEGLEELPPAN